MGKTILNSVVFQNIRYISEKDLFIFLLKVKSDLKDDLSKQVIDSIVDRLENIKWG